MTTCSGGRSRISRRRFVVATLGGSAAVAAGATALTFVGPDEGRPVRAFDVSHGPDVYITMTNGTEFVVEVKERGTRRVLERHEGVTARNLLELQSDHVSIVERA